MEETVELNIEEKLLKIQTELKCGKDLYNKFGNFRYRSAATILEALKPFLVKYGLTIKLCDELRAIGERYYVVAKAILTDVKTREYLECEGYAREERDKKGMDASQITGSCSSYARKYALGGLLALDDGNDADGQNNTIEIPVDEKLLQQCADKDLETVKDEIRSIVELMSDTDPNLEAYQKILYAVVGSTDFKIGECGQDGKSILDNILARLIQSTQQ